MVVLPILGVAIIQFNSEARVTHGYLDTFRILARACLQIRILCHVGIRIPDTVCGYHDVTQNDLKCSSHPLQSAVNDRRCTHRTAVEVRVAHGRPTEL